MAKSHITPVSVALLIGWLSSTGYCQYDPYGGPPYFDEQQPFSPLLFPPEGPPFPQAWPPQQPLIPPVHANPNFINPFLLAANQGQQFQQVGGSYPNLPSKPFKTVSPNNPNPNNPFQSANTRYPFNPTSNFGNFGPENNINNQQGHNVYPFNPNNNFGNVGNGNNNQPGTNKYPFNPNPGNQQQQQQQRPQEFGNAFQYPNFPQFPFQTFNPTQSPQVNRINNQPQANFPNFPFQTISPTQFPQIDRIYNPNVYQKPKVPLPRIRVIEFPSSEYFEYGGGKLVQPKRPNADLYVGGSDGDVPITSKIFIECTGPNQVEWIHNGTLQRKDLSVVTKNIQITLPEQRDPNSGSGEYTYLRLGLEDQISERDSGVFICRDRVLPQNFISIRVLVAKQRGTGRPNYPFQPKDPNTIYYSRSDSSVVLPCKIEDSKATISLHKHEGGKLSCPYNMDGRVRYDKNVGFILQTGAFREGDLHYLEGRYVCVGDFNGELRLMKYRLVAAEDFQTRYVGGEEQNIIALDVPGKFTNDIGTSASASSALLAKIDSFPKSVFSGLTMGNLTGAGLVDPRSEFDFQVAESSSPLSSSSNSKLSTVTNKKSFTLK